MSAVDKKPPKKVWMSWSTGKDSAYALYKLQQNPEYEVVGLLSTITEKFNRVAMHATRLELLQQQANLLNLPLHLVSIPSPCTNEIYEERMHAAMTEAINQEITHVAFGDLFLEDIRKYREARLVNIGIEPLFPLWKIDTHELAREVIACGIKAVITSVDLKHLDLSFVGREYDEKLLRDLPTTVDPCAENGEFHTFVYEAPMFAEKIKILLGQFVEYDGYVFTDLELNS